MLLYSEEQVRNVIKVDDVIAAIRAAFARGFATVHMPVRTVLNMDDAILLVMPCYDSALGAAGVKLVSVSAKAGVQAVYELLDPQTGIAVARMEANYLTDARTAATSAVATDLLAREGCGDARHLWQRTAGSGALCRASTSAEFQAISGVRIGTV